MSDEFASSSYTAGQLNAMVKLLKQQGGDDGPGLFLRRVLTVSKPTRAWREENGVIYFSVTSDGTTGEEWIKRLECEGSLLSDSVKSVLCSQTFMPTSGVTTEVAILKGELFSDAEGCTVDGAQQEAVKRNLEKSSVEVACLAREKFLDRELSPLGFWEVRFMHEPIIDDNNTPVRLYLDGGRQYNRIISTFQEEKHKLRNDIGFAFSVPKK